MVGSVRAALTVGLVGALWSSARALRSRTASQTGATLSDWVYYPPNAEIGIVTGGRPEDYQSQGFASKTASIMLEYAERHRYAFFVDKKLPDLAARPKYWNKVMLMQKLLPEVSTLVWIDPEIVIRNLDTSIEELVQTANCKGTEQGWDQYMPRIANNDTFLILNSDKDPKHSPMNANTGIVILRRKPETFTFLSEVWRIGDDPKHYERYQNKHDLLRNSKMNPNRGWPFEQGAFWDVFLKTKLTYLSHTCVAKGSHLHDVKSAPFSKGNFATNMFGMPGAFTASEANHVLQTNQITPEIH